MLDRHKLDEIANMISNALPDGVRHLRSDIEKNIRTALIAAFKNMDLVTRDEFEIQKKVLERTREKLDAIEAQIAAFEKQESDND